MTISLGDVDDGANWVDDVEGATTEREPAPVVRLGRAISCLENRRGKRYGVEPAACGCAERGRRRWTESDDEPLGRTAHPVALSFRAGQSRLTLMLSVSPAFTTALASPSANRLKGGKLFSTPLEINFNPFHVHSDCSFNHIAHMPPWLKGVHGLLPCPLHRLSSSTSSHPRSLP